MEYARNRPIKYLMFKLYNFKNHFAPFKELHDNIPDITEI